MLLEVLPKKLEADAKAELRQALACEKPARQSRAVPSKSRCTTGGAPCTGSTTTYHNEEKVQNLNEGSAA